MKSNVKTGLVGYFDILGYKNLLEKNEPDEVAEKVFPILTGLNSEVFKSIETMTKGFSGNIADFRDNLISSTEWLVFSDTILFAMPMDDYDPAENIVCWLFFVYAAAIIHKKMFEAGVPVRGAIDYGKYFIKDHCFAGRTIISAYDICNQIDLSACVLSDKATEALQLTQAKTTIKLIGDVVIEYLIPTKQGDRHMHTLSSAIKTDNMHQSVMNAFWANNKDISEAARRKALNTEQYFEYCQMKTK